LQVEPIAEFCASVADEFDPAVGAAIRERYARARRDAPSLQRIEDQAFPNSDRASMAIVGLPDVLSTVAHARAPQ
jgi:hypothetical protein